MKTAIIAKVTADGKLENPPEVLAQFQPFTDYEVSVTEDSDSFQKNLSTINTKRIKVESVRCWFRSKSTNA